jgi:transposase
VWLFHGARPAGHRGEAWLKKGLLCSKQRCPSLPNNHWLWTRRLRVDVVMIGVDPHKRSVTIEARDAREVLRATGTFPTTNPGYRAMLKVAGQWPRRVWAVEGAGGVGRPLAQRLLADGERVLDVPAKLSARVRVFDVGNGRKTDATDAHAVVMAALRDRDRLHELSTDEELMVLRLLVDRRDELSQARAQGLNRLHRLMAELVPGGVPVKKSLPQYQTMLAATRPRDPVRRTLRRLAAEQLADLVRLDTRLKAMKTELRDTVLASGSRLMDLYGIGPAGAARILADVGDVARFPSRNHFASWTGTAPIDASSGAQIRHRLSRAGNRRMNHVLYMAAFVQIRHDTTGRAYYRRKLDTGKTRWKPCAASNGACPTPSTANSWPTTGPADQTQKQDPRRAREGTAGRL